MMGVVQEAGIVIPAIDVDIELVEVNPHRQKHESTDRDCLPPSTLEMKPDRMSCSESEEEEEEQEEEQGDGEFLDELEQAGLHQETYGRLFIRYDLDGNGVVNTHDEFEMLTINLLSNKVFAAQSKLTLKTMHKTVAGAQEELKDALALDPGFGITLDEYIVWFEATFLRGEQVLLVQRRSQKEENEDPEEHQEAEEEADEDPERAEKAEAAMEEAEEAEAACEGAEEAATTEDAAATKLP